MPLYSYELIVYNNILDAETLKPWLYVATAVCYELTVYNNILDAETLKPWLYVATAVCYELTVYNNILDAETLKQCLSLAAMTLLCRHYNIKTLKPCHCASMN